MIPLCWPACMIRTEIEANVEGTAQMHKIEVSVWIRKDKVIILWSNDPDETN